MYRFYNGQRARVVFLQFSNNPCRRIISTGFDTRVSSIAGEREKREMRSKRESERKGTSVRELSAPRSLNPRSELYDRVSRVRLSPLVSCGNSQVLSSRSRRCIDPRHPPSSLFLPFRSSFADPLSCSFISFSLSLIAVFLHFHPVPLLPSCCLLLATPTRRAWRHATNTWANSNICPLLHF